MGFHDWAAASEAVSKRCKGQIQWCKAGRFSSPTSCPVDASGFGTALEWIWVVRKLGCFCACLNSAQVSLYGCCLQWHRKRKRRSCGECKACLCRKDCGTCDFCIDKPKFGGSNKKRQKCRLRQCQRQAMVGVLPSLVLLTTHVGVPV